MSRKNEPEISDQQRAAIVALVAGESVTGAAAAADVARETVSRWVNHDAVFIAALNECRRETWQDSADRLRALVHKSIDAAGELLDHADPDIRLKAAGLVFKALGSYPRNNRPSGPTSKAAVERRQLFDQV